MSVQTQINRIAENIRRALSAVSSKGVSVPTGSNSDDLSDLIGGINNGAGNTATASDILSGKTATVDGVTITGNIPSRTSSNLTVSGATVTVPAGHYAAAASKSVATATQATPTITVGTDGLITASATQTAGYVAAGTKSATKQLTVQSKPATPTFEQQVITPDAGYTFLTSVTVAPIPVIRADNDAGGVTVTIGG